MIIFLLTGMQLSGKTSHAYSLQKKIGITVLETGHAVYYELEKRGLEANYRNTSKIVNECLSKDPLFFIKNILESYYEKHKNTNSLIISGVKSPYEVDYIKKLFARENVTLIAFHASQKTRFGRVKSSDRIKIAPFQEKKRREDTDLARWQNFVERDRREIKLGLGELIATADVLINTEDKYWPYSDFNTSFSNFYSEIVKRLR